MPMIFPGMDPYLERPVLWPGLHNRFVIYLANALRPRLRPRYVASVQARVYVEFPPRQIVPDVAVRKLPRPGQAGPSAVAEIDEAEIVEVPGVEVDEAYLQIIDLESEQRVVTVIEVLSPSNKTVGPGRDLYLQKQREVLASDAHLVEIDLLRTGQHTLSVPEEIARSGPPYDYLVCINRAQATRWTYDLYRRRLRDRLPRIGIPLAGDDADAPVDLQAVLAQTYEDGDYRDRIDYSTSCQPPLSAEDQQWANETIESKNRNRE